MLGYISVDGPGVADALLEAVADDLHARGWPLAGAVQINSDADPGAKCHMDLRILALDRTVRISQNLGTLSKGCRLDASGLETAVGLAEAALEGAPRLVIANKFGKQEVDGRGFRPLIGRALAMDIPVLVAVGRSNLPGFQAFAGDLAEEIPPQKDAILTWAERATAEVTTP